MSIIYSLIAKDKDRILCDYSEFTGNFEQITVKLLKKVQNESIATFCYNNE